MMHEPVESLLGTYHLSCEEAASLEDCYILHMHGSKDRSKIGVAYSDKTVAVHDSTYLKKLNDLGKHKDPISCLRFSPTDNNILYSSSLDGTIKVWDIRTQKFVQELQDDSEQSGRVKPLTSFDISCDGQFICAGTEMYDGDSFLLFWDIRSSELCGGYYESHGDDITQVKYHPEQTDMMISGSTDGLINVFETCQLGEEEALESSLNTASSVDKISWMNSVDGWIAVSCVTHTSDVQFWNMEGVAPERSFSRNTIAEVLKCKSKDDVFVVDVFQYPDPLTNVVLVHFTTETGKPLVLLDADADLQMISILKGNKQIVRCCWYDEQNGILVTGGESGILSAWKENEGERLKSVRPNLKASSKLSNKTKVKPY